MLYLLFIFTCFYCPKNWIERQKRQSFLHKRWIVILCFPLLHQMILQFSVTAQNFWSYFGSLIGLVGRVFANGPGDLGSIPGRIIPKTLKWYLIPPCLTLSNIRYVSRVKWSNPGNGVAPSPKPRCSSYWKGSLLVALDYSRRFYFTVAECGMTTLIEFIRRKKLWFSGIKFPWMISQADVDNLT